MVSPPNEKLSRREREIMHALHALGDRASVEEIRQRLSDPPSYSAVRAMLVKLEAKGFVRHREEGLRYVYAGNLPGQVGDLEDTRCPSCGATVIGRRGYRVTHRAQDERGRCLACRTPIAGYWTG